MTITPAAAGQSNRPPPTDKTSLLESWAEFNAAFPSELDCREYMFRNAQEAGVVRCPRCWHAKVHRKYGDRMVGCRRCGKRWSFTAGTFFERTRGARPWVGAIWLMEHGFMVSSLRLASLVNIAYSTAWTILQKLAAALQIEMGIECEEVPSSRFWRVVCKRSRETPARSHPSAEQEELDNKGYYPTVSHSADVPQSSPEPVDGGPELWHGLGGIQPSHTIKNDVTQPIPKDDDSNEHGLERAEKIVYDCLSADPIHFDVLHERTSLASGALSAALTMLEIYGLASSTDGNCYVRAGPHPGQASGHQFPTPLSHTVSASQSSRFCGPIQSILRFFHGTSRKYVQPYLARCWCQADRARWGLGAAMQACFRFGPLTYAQILNYVSPPMVKVFVRA